MESFKALRNELKELEERKISLENEMHRHPDYRYYDSDYSDNDDDNDDDNKVVDNSFATKIKNYFKDYNDVEKILQVCQDHLVENPSLWVFDQHGKHGSLRHWYTLSYQWKDPKLSVNAQIFRVTYGQAHDFYGDEDNDYSWIDKKTIKDSWYLGEVGFHKFLYGPDDLKGKDSCWDEECWYTEDKDGNEEKSLETILKDIPQHIWPLALAYRICDHDLSDYR